MKQRIFWLVIFLAGYLCSACSRKPELLPDHTFIIAQSDDIIGLSPNLTMEYNTANALANVYESLVHLDADMKTVPALAESWENPDRLTWLFHLRRGVRFHHGSEMKARDVKYSLDKMRQEPLQDYGNLLSAISMVTIIDDYTIAVRTATPMRLLNDLVYVNIIPDGAVLGNDAAPPPGTGPYRISEWKKGERVYFVAVPGYWNGDPPVKRALLIPVPDDKERLRAILNGRADLVPDPPLSRVGDLVSSETVHVVKRNGLLVALLVFDSERERIPGSPGKNPFLDFRVRQALNIAIDRTAITEGVLHGYATEATQYLAPDVFGYNAEIKNPPLDDEKAHQLLVQAGYPNGFKATLVTREFRADVATALQEQLKQIDVVLDVRMMNGREFVSTLKSGHCSMVLTEWSCDTGDGQALYDFWFRTPLDRGASWLGELGRYNNPEAEALLRTLATTVDPRERLDLLSRINDTVLRDLPWLPLYVQNQIVAISNDYDLKQRADGVVLLANIKPRAAGGAK